MPRSRGPLPCFTEIPGLSRNTSPTENAGLLSNWLRSIVVCVCPVGAWSRFSRAALAVTFFVCVGADTVVRVAAGGRVCRRADVKRTFGVCTAGLARSTRGASMVTGGNIRSPVWAFAIEGISQSALQSMSVPALRNAYWRNI
jgi:hypothetical protein